MVTKNAQTSNGGRLGGGENTRENAAQDDEQGHHAPHGFLADLQRLLERNHLALWVIALSRKDQAQRHQAEVHHDAGDDAGHEQRSDGNGAASGEGVQHRVVAGGCQQRLHRTTDGDGGGELTRIAAAFHFRDQHRTDRSGIGYRGTGDRAEKTRGHEVDQ